MASSSGLGSILVVDDDPELRRMLEMMLTRVGYDVTIASDGAEGMDAIRTRHFDLVISDLGMPVVDGLDLLHAIRSQNIDVDVLIISAIDSIPKAVEAVKLGAVNYVEKPFDPTALKEQVRTILRSRESTQLVRSRAGGTPPSSGPKRGFVKQQARPERLGRYEIVREIGGGGMGIVYEAVDPHLGRTVAIKTLRDTLLADPVAAPDFVERFRREARAAGRLLHPNVAAVYDLAEDENTGVLFVAMEYIRGKTLSEVLYNEGPLPVARAIPIMHQMADGLELAHRYSIVHRDIKPANIMICDHDHVKILDFGIAKLNTSELTKPGFVVGSPAYLSPEAARSQPVDYRADQFSLGIVFVELLSGCRWFEGGALPATIKNILDRKAPQLSELKVEAPPELEAVIQKLLEKDPDQRYFNEMELLGDLAKAGAALGITLRPALPRS